MSDHRSLKLRKNGMACVAGIAAWFVLSAVATRAAEPSTQPAAAAAETTVVGKVTAESEVPLSEMVVYLESPDPTRPLPPPPKESVKVSQKGAKFAPALVIVSVGQTVDFLNDEDRLIEHNVFSNAPPKRFDLGLYKPGEARSVTFDQTGAVFLYCSIHRHMDGVVFVAPTPWTSRVDANGLFKISGAPPGDWIVKTWQRRRRFKELALPVVLKPGVMTSTALELKKK